MYHIGFGLLSSAHMVFFDLHDALLPIHFGIRNVLSYAPKKGIRGYLPC